MSASAPSCLSAGNLMQTDHLMAGIVVMSVLGLVVGGFCQPRLERTNAVRWR